jgi:hypothetical protein
LGPPENREINLITKLWRYGRKRRMALINIKELSMLR